MRKSYSGNSEATTLAESITTGATGFTTVAATNYPTGVNGPFVITIGRDTPSEEKLLCSSRTGNIFVVQQRGWDGTSVQAHAAGDSVEHTIDADSFDDFAGHVYDTTRNDHTQYLLKTGGTLTGLLMTNLGQIPAGSQSVTEDFVSRASLTSGGDLIDLVVRHRRGPTDTLADARVDLFRRDNNATSGFPQLTFATDEILIANVRLRMTTSPIYLIDGDAANMALAFTTDTDTGIYKSNTDVMTLVAGGQPVVNILSTHGLAAKPWRIPDGTVGAPGLTFWGNNDNDTGLYKTGDGAFAAASNGVQIVRVQSSGLVMQNGQLYVVPGSAGAPGLAFNNDTDTGIFSDTGDRITFATAGGARIHINNTQLRPHADNAMSLGLSGGRYTEVWAANGTIQTSDSTQKTGITELSLGIDFINALQPVSAKMRGGSRPHAMLLAQQVKQAMDTLGIEDFAGYIDPSVNDEEGPLGLRYSEFIAPLVKGEQQLYEYIKRLEQRIEELENA